MHIHLFKLTCLYCSLTYSSHGDYNTHHVQSALYYALLVYMLYTYIYLNNQQLVSFILYTQLDIHTHTWPMYMCHPLHTQWHRPEMMPQSHTHTAGLGHTCQCQSNQTCIGIASIISYACICTTHRHTYIYIIYYTHAPKYNIHTYNAHK